MVQSEDNASPTFDLACDLTTSVMRDRKRVSPLPATDKYEMVAYKNEWSALYVQQRKPVSPKAAAASNALALTYGFGASIDPFRRECALLRRSQHPAPDRPFLKDCDWPRECKMRGFAADALKTFEDGRLWDRDTAVGVASLFCRAVLDETCTSTFISMRDLDIQEACSALDKAWDEGRLVDDGGVVKAEVTIRTGAQGMFAVVRAISGQCGFYDMTSLELMRLVSSHLQHRAEGKDAELVGDGYRLRGLEATQAAVFPLVLSPHGWFSVYDKLCVANEFALVSNVDGKLFTVRVKNDTFEDLWRDTFGALALLDAVFGSKVSSTDRLAIALTCHMNAAGAALPSCRRIWIAVGPNQSGVDWARMDHVIAVDLQRPSAQDNMAATYLHKPVCSELQDVLQASPFECFAGAAVLAGACPFWVYGYDGVAALMVILPLLLRQELVAPWELWRIYRLGAYWEAQRGQNPLSAYLDVNFYRELSQALVALLLSVTTFTTSTPVTFTEWAVSLALVGVVVVWLLFLGFLYTLIRQQHSTPQGFEVSVHYEGSGRHCEST